LEVGVAVCVVGVGAVGWSGGGVAVLALWSVGFVVVVVVVVMGACVGVNPHMSHCKCAAVRTYMHTGQSIEVFVEWECVVVLLLHTWFGSLGGMGGGALEGGISSSIGSNIE
jgi:hypothetical protein